MSPVSRCLVARNGTTKNGFYTNHHYLLLHIPHVLAYKKIANEFFIVGSCRIKNMFIENETLTNVDLCLICCFDFSPLENHKKAFRTNKMAKVFMLPRFPPQIFFILLALRGRNRADSNFLLVVFESTSVDNWKCPRRTEQ